MLMTVIALLIVLGIVVFIHELGHFLAARWAGVRVNVFSIGFGKPIFKWKDSLGTEWRIAWLPLGGFVNIYGMEDMFNQKKYNSLSKKKKVGHYLSVPGWKQAIIIAAGVFMNIVLAWFIYIFLFIGTQKIQLPIVGHSETEVIKTGDIIMQVDDVLVISWSEMLMQKELGAGNDIHLVILRGDKLVQLNMPYKKWGVLPDSTKVQTVKYGFFKAAGKATKEIYSQSKMMVVVLKQMITGERSSKQLGGFISIAEISGQALSEGIATLFALIALISVNLAVINLFPLPVLDGGYLLILAIQGIIRRKLHGKTMEFIMRCSWGLLIILIAFTLWNDILRLIQK